MISRNVEDTFVRAYRTTYTVDFNT